MLKKENRLKRNKHFNYIYKHGVCVKTEFINLVYIKTKVKPFQVGFSVNNKIGKAVVRNKVKRRMKEIVSSITLDIDRRFNYIFIAKEGIENLSFDDLKENIILVIKKANLINENN